MVRLYAVNQQHDTAVVFTAVAKSAAAQEIVRLVIGDVQPEHAVENFRQSPITVRFDIVCGDDTDG